MWGQGLPVRSARKVPTSSTEEATTPNLPDRPNPKTDPTGRLRARELTLGYRYTSSAPTKTKR